MDESIRTTVRQMGSLIRHKAKALGLNEAHRLQRHRDGSYTITFRLVPEGVDADGSGVDGVVICQSRSFRALNG